MKGEDREKNERIEGEWMKGWSGKGWKNGGGISEIMEGGISERIVGEYIKE